MKKILCILLALIMCFGTTLNVFAQSNDTKYVSDIKIGYGESGKQALINAGYIVNENFNANLNGRGDSVWIGFLETDDPFDAITDISVMRMNGSYSFSGWAEEYEELREYVDTILEDFTVSIEEFKTNFKEHSPFAELALELLNYFTDDDFTGECIGDLLLDNDTSREDIYNVFLMGNVNYVSVIELCIAMGCTEWKDEDDTFVTRLERNGYAKTYDVSANHQRELIGNALSDLQENLLEMQTVVSGYEEVYAVNADDYESLDDYVNKTLTESEMLDYYEYTSLVSRIENIVLTTEGGGTPGQPTNAPRTLYDLVMRDSSEWTEEDYETLRLAMTPGQIASLVVVGLDDLLEFEAGVHDGTNNEQIDTIMDKFYELDTDTVSVYYGVDTTVYTDPESVALTSEALREMNASDNVSYGVKKEEEGSLVHAIIGGVCGGIALACFIGTFAVHSYARNFVWLRIADGSGVTMHWWPQTIMSKAAVNGICSILGVIAIVAISIMFIMFLSGETSEPSDISYKQIPRAIVDLKETDGEKIYYTYTAAKRIDAIEDSENTLEIYGDLNAYNKKNEWVAVYYSKNRDLGNPITSDVLVNPSEIPDEGYTPFHEFGSTTATDLNKCNSGIDSKEIYAYVKTTVFPTSEVQNASVFSSGTVIMLASVGFVAGACLAGGVTYKKTKKKYFKEA